MDGQRHSKLAWLASSLQNLLEVFQRFHHLDDMDKYNDRVYNVWLAYFWFIREIGA
jgi:hypothetical protein